MRERVSKLATTTVKRTDERFALSHVVSEESLIELREFVLSISRGVRLDPHADYEHRLWWTRAVRALKGNRDATKLIDRLLYGWIEKDAAFEERVLAALGCSIAEARRAVEATQSAKTGDPHGAAESAVQLLLWYTRTQAVERSVSDGIRQCAEACERGRDTSSMAVVEAAPSLVEDPGTPSPPPL